MIDVASFLGALVAFAGIVIGCEIIKGLVDKYILKEKDYKDDGWKVE